MIINEDPEKEEQIENLDFEDAYVEARNEGASPQEAFEIASEENKE